MTSREAVLVLAGKRTSGEDVLRLQFPGAETPALRALDRLPTKVNYLIGSDRSRWRTGIPTYGRVRYAHLWPGIDASFHGSPARLEYDFRLAPRADARRIALRFVGARREHIDARGALVLSLPGGRRVRELAPTAYQLVNGSRRAVASRFALAAGVARIRLGTYDHRHSLIVDPAVVYSTYLGGTGDEQGSAVAVDSAGDAYISGATTSTDFPTQNPLQPSNGGSGFDAFVTKINPAGSALIYSTYVGGDKRDLGGGIAVDASQNVYITGLTQSTNFPTHLAAQPKSGGGEDSFVAKLNSNGSAFAYSTYLGGSGNDSDGNSDGPGIAVDSAGNAYVGGTTTSNNFPTKSPEQPACGDPGCSGGDAFVTKFNSTGALAYSTYLGGTSNDIGRAIGLDGSGQAYITGYTISSDFPTRNPLQPANAGQIDSFITKFNSAGNALIYSTYLGGSGPDATTALTVDAAGDAYVTGTTLSKDFPTQNPEQLANGGGSSDAFVAKLNPAGSALGYSTYLGGGGQDIAFAITVDSSGNAYAAGYTTSTNFPTVDAAQPSCGDPNCSLGDAFLTKIDPAGSALAYSSYLGGSGKEQAYGVAVDNAGAAYVTGFTSSTSDFPGQNPLQPGYGGGAADAFVAKFAGPDTTAPTSSATIPVCQGPVVVTVKDNAGGTGPIRVHFRLDGGAEQHIATSGDPGLAFLPIPEGNHTLETWGEDRAGNLEFPHDVARVQIDTTPPAVSITSDQGFSSYEIGDRASVTVTASDATSGLAGNPSLTHKVVSTAEPGDHKVTSRATDHCGNAMEGAFTYVVIANPTEGRNVNLEARSGTVLVRVRAAAGATTSGDLSRRGFVSLVGARQVPVGTIVDATAGQVRITAATARRGRLQAGVFKSSRFRVLQRRAKHSLVELRMIDPASGRTCKRAARTAATSAIAARTLGLLRARVKGRFRTSGRYAWATSGGSGAAWSIADRCDGTLIRVTHGRVTARNLRNGANTVVRAGHRYLARA